MDRMFRTATIAGALIAAVFTLGGSTMAATPTPLTPGHYSTPEMTATYPVPLPAEGDVICTGQTVGAGTIERIAWQEIGELRNLGLPVCDIRWQFGDTQWRGAAMATERGTVVRIGIELSKYPEPDRGVRVRSVVRHEVGHAIHYAAGYTIPGDLDGIFTDNVLWSNEDTDRGWEVAAESAAIVLANMRHDDRYPSAYLECPSPESMRAAGEMVRDYATSAGRELFDETLGVVSAGANCGQREKSTAA